MPTLMLVDGNSLTYRAFYALPEDLSTASGQVTNAVFGFTSMLINLVRDHQPDGILVAFDRPEPTFRHERLPEYKANRSKAPDVLYQQLGLVKQVLDTLAIAQVDVVGFEADDILATMAHKAEETGHDVLVVTGDRDSYQLVRDPHIKVVYNKRGVSDYAFYDEAGIADRTGVAPADYVQYAALRGDKSDNLEGVPGVGEKTAAKLVNQYQTIDGIYENLSELTPKLRQNLSESETRVRANVELMQLRFDAPVSSELDELFDRQPYDQDEVNELFGFLEFHSLLKRLGEAFNPDRTVRSGGSVTIEPKMVPVDTDEQLVSVLDRLLDGSLPVAVAFSETHNAESPSWAAFVVDADASEVAVVPYQRLTAPGLRDRTTAIFGSNGPGVVVFDAKRTSRWMLAEGLSLSGLKQDPSIAAYLLDPASGSYVLAELVETYTDWLLSVDAAPASGQLDFGDTSTNPRQTLGARALAVDYLYTALSVKLETGGLAELHDTMEVPLIGVLARMEDVGIGVDRAELERLNAEMVTEVASLTAEIHEEAGEVFNVNSTKVLRRILFEELGLTPQKKTKTGYSTDQATLEKIRHEHPVVEKLLRYREVEKLRSTYGQSLLAAVEQDDRIRATFRQNVARTGRLSSENPNLHNIPVRTELGREFRKAFVPSSSKLLLVADYNQIELRCIAHLAEDPGLIAAFQSDQDVHRMTAARVFNVAEDKVSADQRSYAKMVSYGLAYGMEAYGLAQRLGVKTGEAQEILDAYFAGFPAVKDYMDTTVSEARNKGYTETLFGRRRQIPELLSDNRNVRLAGERQAMNAGIQGLAADIFKVALVRLDQRLFELGGQSCLVLQVHDEVLVEVEPGNADELSAVVTEEMGNAFEMKVPLTVNLAVGRTWADAKG